MRSIVVCSFLLLIYIGCKDPELLKAPDAIEVVDTQMAELLKEQRITKKDSIKLLHFWKQFRELLLKNDTNEIARLSLQNVYCPVYQNEFNYYNYNELVPLYFFLRAPHRGNYIASFSSLIITAVPTIMVYPLDSPLTVDLGFNQNNKPLSFSLSFNTNEIKDNFLIHRDHSFEFVKINDSFKFMGLRVQENGSSYQYKLMSCDDLYLPLYRNKQDTITNANSLDTSLNKWYSRCLLQMREPNIYTCNNNDEIYRFTWLRSFHNPIVIRLQKQKDSYILYTKELEDNRGYIPQQMKVDNRQELPITERDKINEKIRDANFWQMSSNDPQPVPNDGAQWILEVILNNKYHFVQRNMPADEDKKFRDACLYFLSLTKLDIPKKDQY